MNKLPDWLRWILFFPASIIMSIIIYPLIIIGNYFFNLDDNSIFLKIFVNIVGAVYSGYLFVWIAVKIVPKHQLIIAIVMTTFYAFLSGVSLSGKLILKEQIDSGWFELLSFIIISTISAINACYQTYENIMKQLKNSNNLLTRSQNDLSSLYQIDERSDNSDEIEDESNYKMSHTKISGINNLSNFQKKDDNLIHFHCFFCGVKYSTKKEQAGKKGICKQCGSEIIVPFKNDCDI